MRAPTTLTSALLLLLGACAPGNTVIHVQDPAPAPAPEPALEPDLPDPLEITVGRPIRGKVLVQTNRPAYVAIFEIVPERGVTLVQPSSAQGRRFVVSGLSTVPVWWSVERGAPTGSRTGTAALDTRYIYAVASDEPLRLPEEAFRPGYLRRVLGTRGYRAEAPYATMRALSRQFVPDVTDEEWAEDAYALTSTASTQAQIARVYCPDGTIFEVPAELADRALCQDRGRIVQGTVRRGPAVRPDSVVAESGRRIRAHATNGRRLADRVTEPEVATTGGSKPDDRGNSGNNGHGNNGHGNNGHAYGHDKDDKPAKVEKTEKDDKRGESQKPRGLAGRALDAADDRPKPDDSGRKDEPKPAPAQRPKPAKPAKPAKVEKPAADTATVAAAPEAEQKPRAEEKHEPKAEEKQEGKGDQGGAKGEGKRGLKERVRGDDKQKGKEGDKGDSKPEGERGNSGKPDHI